MGIHQEVVEMKLNRNDPEGQGRSYKMKKLIAILLVLLVASVAFGADAQLDLAANVGLRQQVLITDYDGITNKGEFDAANTGTPVEISLGTFDADDAGTEYETPFYLYLLTNQKAATLIELKGTPLQLSGGTTEDVHIGYTITTTAEGQYTVPLVVDNEDDTTLAGASFTTVGTFGAGNGMRVQKAPATIALASADLLLASEGAYSASVVVNIVSN